MNVLDFVKKKQLGKKITMVTCYDFTSAKIIASSDVDCVLIGDSSAMVMHGHPSTLPASIEMMTWHTAAVARALKNQFIVADLPFLTFRKGLKPAMDAVEKLIQAGAHGVKIEGVTGHEDIIRHIVDSGIPVMGHLGLIPQSVNGLGGYKVQGQTVESSDLITTQAKQLEELGCFAIVLECVAQPVADQTSKNLIIPTIGIGAGANTDGQVLVWQDLLGLTSGHTAKFVRSFVNGKEIFAEALNSYCQAVEDGTFPASEETYESH